MIDELDKSMTEILADVRCAIPSVQDEDQAEDAASELVDMAVELWSRFKSRRDAANWLMSIAEEIAPRGVLKMAKKPVKRPASKCEGPMHEKRETKMEKMMAKKKGMK